MYVKKLMDILETLGAILIVAAFSIWSGDYWKTSNVLWWTGLVCVAPVIAWKAWPQSLMRKVFVGVMFCLLVVIGKWWFGDKNIKARIPHLPEVTIRRSY